jgi:hypothetical protein
MDDSNVSHSNEARTCAVASARSGRPSGTPSDARSSSAAEPGTQGRPDDPGAARVRAPRDPAVGWERARKGVSEVGTPANGVRGRTKGGGGVTPLPKRHRLVATRRKAGR